MTDAEGKHFPGENDHVQTVEALQRDGNLTLSLLEAAPDAVVVIDHHGHIVLVNARTETLFAYTREELLDNSIEILVPVRFRDRHAGFIAAYFGSPEARPMGMGRDLFGRRKDGSEFPIEVSLSTVETEVGSLAMSFIVDITARKEAEHKLHEAMGEVEKQFRAADHARSQSKAIIDSASDAMVLISPDRTVLSTNRVFYDIFFAGDGPEVVGRPFTEFGDVMERIFPDAVGVRELLLNTVSDAESEFSQVVSQRWPQARELQISSTPVLAQDGEYLGRLYAFRDVTHEREVDRMKTEFVSIVSHELRTPLTTIKGFTDMVLEGDAGEINEEQREFLTIVKQDSDRLVALVNDLLDISRIESGRIDLDIKALDLGSVVRDVVRTLKPSIDEKGQTLQVDIDPELSPIMGDSDRLHQVVTNLLSNAYKYTPDSGSLTIKVAKEGDLAKVSVSDTGVGISKEDQERLFTRFFRADSSLTRDVGGTGLGLTIVKSLVEMHGGTVSVVSEPGIGSTFSFTIPIGVSLAKEVAPRLDEAISEAALATSGRRILVVEDEPAIAKLLQHYLEQSGYRVEIAGNAEEALARIDAYPPDLITLDIKLPGQDGMELVEKLDQDPIMAKIPILIVSVLEYDESSIHHGLVDSLLKPIDGGQLIGTVGRMLAESKSEKVLIIDDDPGVRTFLIKALMKKGYEALGAGDGESGLVIAERDHPGLILLDLRLPGMDGFAVLKKLKSNPKTARLPVIAMSGSESFKTGARARLLTLGAVDFITKPFNMETLLEEIKTLMQGGVE